MPDERVDEDVIVEKAVREYAAGLPDDFGPLFGRDVIRCLDRLQARLKAAEAEVVARTWTCFACSEARERMHAAEDALAAAKADAERLKAPWLCDCHTLTGPDEAHDYIVALEADAERLAEALTELLTYVVELRRCTA